jgi:MFS family permease
MNRKPSLLVIFLSVFIDLIGFGIVLPLLPGFAEDDFHSAFSARGLIIGGIIASFSAMQFFFAPVWGRLSDRIGRRPVMLISNLGAAGSYSLFAIACGLSGAAGLWMILVSRMFAGICGANLSVASAYIADISPPEKRSARMGLIGMAFGRPTRPPRSRGTRCSRCLCFPCCSRKKPRRRSARLNGRRAFTRTAANSLPYENGIR